MAISYLSEPLDGFCDYMNDGELLLKNICSSESSSNVQFCVEIRCRIISEPILTLEGHNLEVGMEASSTS
jgi:hypothetical protein